MQTTTTTFSSQTWGTRHYQRAWLRNVEAFLRSSKVDGVFIDDVMADTRSWTGQEEFPLRSTRRRRRGRRPRSRS